MRKACCILLNNAKRITPPMSPRKYWNAYVKKNGGVRHVSERLSIPYSTVYAVHTGHRGIGKKLAQHMVDQDPNLDKSVLVFVTAEKKDN